MLTSSISNTKMVATVLVNPVILWTFMLLMLVWQMLLPMIFGKWQKHQPLGNNIYQTQTMAIPSAILAITSANKEKQQITVVHLLAQLKSHSGNTNSHNMAITSANINNRLQHQPGANNITIHHINQATWQ